MVSFPPGSFCEAVSGDACRAFLVLERRGGECVRADGVAAKLEQYTDIEGVVRGPYDMGLGSSSTMYYGTSLQYAEWNRTWC